MVIYQFVLCLSKSRSYFEHFLLSESRIKRQTELISSFAKAYLTILLENQYWLSVLVKSLFSHVNIEPEIMCEVNCIQNLRR